MSGFFNSSVPIRTDKSMFVVRTFWSAVLVPDYLVGRQHRSRQARSDVMEAAVLAAHRHDAAVAAAHPAAHDAFDRDLARPPVADGEPGARGQHAVGAARIQHQRTAAIGFGELALE